MTFEPERFARDVVRHAADAIIYADADGIIRFWNGAAARIFGFTAAAAIGQSLDIIIPENLRQRHWDGYRATVRTGQTRYGAGARLRREAAAGDRPGAGDAAAGSAAR